MLSYSSAFWPMFWVIILGGAALTVLAVAGYAVSARNAAMRCRPHPALATIPAPRRPAESMAPTTR